MEYRFDLGAKYFYIKCYNKKINTEYHKELYFKHMNTFNGCWEHPGTKVGIEQFYKEFNKLIESIKNEGFNRKYPIPLGCDKKLINGSHRLMVSLYYDAEPVFLTQPQPGLYYNYNFFLTRTGLPPLDREYADFIALQNLELFKKNNEVRSIIIFPIATRKGKDREIEKILDSYGVIMYKKQVNLSKNGNLNLIKELYRGEDWVGGLFPEDRHVNGKSILCHDNSHTTFYMFKFRNKTRDIEMKKKLRNLFNIENHSLHISDYYKDTFRIASLLLNNNSINFLNKKQGNISLKLKKLLTKYFETLNEDNEDFCLTSSVILDMYGLREANDIDYLNIKDIQLGLENIHPHTGEWLKYYTCNKDNIIYNPKNYFYFNGFKFATLDIIKKMKINRKEPKDLKDINLINKNDR